MGKVVRNVIAVIAGFVAASAVMMWIEREAIRALMANAPMVHALVLGGLLTLAGIANNLMLAPPAWFWIVSLVVFLPAACAGARLAPRTSQATA